MVSREGKVFIVKGVKRKDLESAECAMEGLSDRTSDQEFYQKLGVNWDLRVVNKSYEWVEKAVVFRPELRNWQSSVRDGLLEAGVDPYNGFSLVGTKIGGSTFDGSGRRHSAADLLNYENPVNIKVAVYASVEKNSFSLFFALFWIEAIGNEAASNVIPFASTARSVFIRNLASPLYLTAATLMEKITGPLSAGSLRLASTDVRVNPIVRFNYSGNGTVEDFSLEN
ncbi:(R)-mandelonitrile lyase-like [Sesamum angolense]|uniref:(R)-mandelonitrile lyase-like n=1 Tax=Sesamum angolense TaxID=2727404 RepID=A0AAE1VWU8_9LAMI|nr:(R)-mandelonitrile lyase-like [Sesamum angolense]